MAKQKSIRKDIGKQTVKSEFINLEEIAAKLKPESGEYPKLRGMDIYGDVYNLNKIGGGDHVIYLDFNQRYDLDIRIREAIENNRVEVAEKLELNKHRAGILIWRSRNQSEMI